MTALILRCFEHEHNAREAACQDYELAKEHFRQVLLHRQPGNPWHEQRFRDAVERREAARDRFVTELCR